MSTFTARYNSWADNRKAIRSKGALDVMDRFAVSDFHAVDLLHTAADILAPMARLFADTMLLGDLAERFTCQEADTIAGFIAATIGQDQAGEFTLLHAQGDTPADSHFDLKENTDA